MPRDANLLETINAELQSERDNMAEMYDRARQRVTELEAALAAAKARLAMIDRAAVVAKAKAAGLTDVEIETLKTGE